MCYRYVCDANQEDIAEVFGVPLVKAEFTPSAIYNIAPTCRAWVVRGHPARELAALRWGLVPSWARATSFAARLCNARAESLTIKPALRSAYQHRRCVVPATGFYEWRQENGRHHSQASQAVLRLSHRLLAMGQDRGRPI